jgi:uncharacterized protein YndB with AHSA1/START domain
MPIKKDGTGTRWIEMEFVTPGTPEQVWEAMATGPGNTAWFTKATIDGRVGGAIELDMGTNGKQKGEVTAWEPPTRVAFVEREWSEGAPPVATEITITARSGDRCTVRMVHSLFTSLDDWDDQMEGFEKGWPGFFEVLRLYLTHFPGQHAASFMAMSMTDGDHLSIWKRMLEELDLTAPNVGEHRTSARVPESISGIVERVDQVPDQRYIIMRLQSPGPGIAIFGTNAMGSQVGASMMIYFYGDGADARAAGSEQKWREWLGARFAAPAEASA